MSFQPKRQLLNPKFDGYKLSPVSEADAVASFQLPGSGISQSTVSPQSHLLFPEVQSRIRHNHLAIAQDKKSVCYIDKDGQVVLVTLDEVCSYQQVLSGPCSATTFDAAALVSNSNMSWSPTGHSNPKLSPDLRYSAPNPNLPSRIVDCGISVRSLAGSRCLDRVRWNWAYISPPYYFRSIELESVNRHGGNYGG